MVPTYAMRADNIAVIPFAPEIDDVLIYPDLIKVNVALDNGEVVGYEALGYIMSHHTGRSLSPRSALKRQGRQLIRSCRSLLPVWLSFPQKT